MKICSSCNKLKSETDFNKCSKNKDGLQYRCRDCQKRTYYDNHQHNLEYDRNRTNSDERKKYKQIYDKEYYSKNKDKILNYHKEYYNRFGSKELTEEQKEKRKQWYQENKDKLNEQKTKFRHNNSKIRLNESVSAGIYYALKENKAGCHWENLVNFTFEDLVNHLEKQFTQEMSWDNYGSYWEIDHIIPVNTFNFKSHGDKDFKICWSLQNLRPLEKIANRKRPKDGSDISMDTKTYIERSYKPWLKQKY